VSERGQEQRSGGPHPTTVGPWFAMRPQSQARSAGSGRFRPVPAASHYFEVHPGRKEGLVNGQAKVYRDSKSAN